MDRQVVYNVGLLDDIHNYFPELLYDSGRFTNITQIFSYVRNQMNTRFNLFNYGASLYREHLPGRVVRTRQTPQTPVRHPIRQPIRRNTSDFQAASILLGIFDNLDLRQGLDPVIVHPTAAEIDAGSELMTLTEAAECGICQDSITTTETARRLRSCQHVYHRTCIDQWFQRSVTCPTCRHDIREA